MRHRIGADLLGDLDLALGDQRPRDRRAEQILALVQRIGAEHREDVILDEGIAQILDENLLNPHQLGLLARRAEFFPLPDIGGEGNHLRRVGFLQPAQNHGGVEAARKGEHDLLDVILHGRGLDGVKPRSIETVPITASERRFGAKSKEALGRPPSLKNCL